MRLSIEIDLQSIRQTLLLPLLVLLLRIRIRQHLQRRLFAQLALPFSRLCRQLLPCLHWVVQGSNTHRRFGFSRHERLQPQERRPDPPCRLPHLFVKSSKGQTDLLVELPPSVGREEHEVGWTHGIFRRQEDATMVQAVGKLSVGRAAKGEMPFKDVVFERRSRVEVGLILGQLASFRENALHRRRFLVVRGCGGHVAMHLWRRMMLVVSENESGDLLTRGHDAVACVCVCAGGGLGGQTSVRPSFHVK